jgi:hypothetical protein
MLMSKILRRGFDGLNKMKLLKQRFELVLLTIDSVK